MPRIRLVTRGDDAGSARSANRAIRDAFREGVLRNVSVMAPAPEIEDAAAVFRAETEITIGLHVTLTAEWDFPRWGPVLPPERVPSIVDENGHLFRDTRTLHERGAQVDEMVAEVEAQLRRLRDLGLPVAYLDEHMGVGWLPGLRDALAGLCRREGLIDAHGLRGLPRVDPPGPDIVADTVARLDAAPPGDYVLVAHPVYPDDEMARFHGAGIPLGELGLRRDGERRVFTDDRIREALQRNDAEAVSYRDVLGG